MFSFLKNFKHEKGNHKGFTLIEILISLTILTALTISIYDLTLQSFKIVQNNKLKMGAIILADQKIENIRNLPYNDIGTVSGIVHGVLLDNENATNNNGSYQINTLVTYVDDPFDGLEGGIPDDDLATDYKKVRVKVRWNGPFGYKEVSNYTDIAPKNIETSVGGGTLIIDVFDAEGKPVADADIAVVNNNISPAVNQTVTTNASGTFVFYGAPPSVEGYQITASKTGYSTSSSSPRTVQNPNPTIPNATVNIDQKTQIGFSIDRLSVLTLKTIHQNLPQNWKINSDSSTDNQTNSRMVIDSSGNLYIVWQDFRNGSGGKIYAQKYNSSHVKAWTDDKEINSANNQVLPDIVVDAIGNLYISWNDNSTGNQDIYMVKLNSLTGEDVWGGANRVDTDANNKDQISSRISLNADKSKVNIVWQDNRNNDSDIFLQQINSSKLAAWSPEKIVGSTSVNDGSNQVSPVIAVDPSDNIFIAWTDDRNGNQDVYLQKYDSAGIKQWPNDLLINSNADSTNQSKPSMAFSTSTLYISWTDERNGNKDIYAQKIDGSGNKLWSDILVNSDSGITDQYDPSIAVDSSGNTYLTWTDERNGNKDIYAQKISLSASKQWSPDLKVNIDISSAAQYNSFVSINPNTDQAFATWQDDRVGNFDIYASSFDVYGPISEIPDVPITITGTKRIGENPIIYKFEKNYTSDPNGTILISNLEWDTYSVKLQAGYTDKEILMITPPSPFSVNPGSNSTVNINLD